MQSGKLLLVVLFVGLCQGRSVDVDDVATVKDSTITSYLQPLGTKLREDEHLAERKSRELGYFGAGYKYSPYGGNPYNPYGQISPYNQYNPYNQYSPYAGGLSDGFAGGIGGGIGGGMIGGGGIGGYGYGVQGNNPLAYGAGSTGYPYANGLNPFQSPYGYRGNQLGGIYSRGIYI